MSHDADATPDMAPPRTGRESLDSVLDLVAGLDERSLNEHAAAFEAAHAELRRPLEQPGPNAPA